LPAHRRPPASEHRQEGFHDRRIEPSAAARPRRPVPVDDAVPKPGPACMERATARSTGLDLGAVRSIRRVIAMIG